MINRTGRALAKPIRDAISMNGNSFDIDIIDASDSNNPFDSDIYKIQAKLILIQGPGVNRVVFEAFMNYVEENIKQVFTSPKIREINGRSDEYVNKGLPEDIVIDGGDIEVEEYSRGDNEPYIDAVNPPPENGTLEDKENLFVVLDNASERSFVMDSYNRRLGTFFISNSWFPWVTLHNGEYVFNNIPGGIRNEPAHEFAHILGLVDRYSIIVERDNHRLVTNVGPNESSVGIMKSAHRNNLGSLSRWNAATVPLFLDEVWDYEKVNKDALDEEENIDEDYHYGYDKENSYDIEYATQYRWRFNLMTTANEVPNDISDESHTFRQLYNHHNYPSQSDNNIAINRYHNICIFITTRQWEIIYNKKDEENELSMLGKTMLMFTGRDLSIFDGTFAGLKEHDGDQPISGDFISVTDHSYDLDRRSNDFNNFHHIMNGRILDDDEPDPNKLFNKVLADFLDQESYIKPYEGSPSMDLEKVIDDEHYPDKLFVGDGTDYDPRVHVYEDYKDSSNLNLIRHYPESKDDWPGPKLGSDHDNLKDAGFTGPSNREENIWNWSNTRQTREGSKTKHDVYPNRVIILEILREVEG